MKINYLKYINNKSYLLLFGEGIFLLLLSTVVNFYAGSYATLHASSSVTDIILSNTRVYDVDSIFIFGPIILTLLIIFIALSKPQYAPFIAKSIALFVVIRSVFISLTHISPFPDHIAITSTFFNNAYFTGVFRGDDLFFSGHTGIPFLMALMFWDNKFLRYIFLSISFLFGTIVLLGHLHYSIDVLSAFFITYSIFHICLRMFKKEWRIFVHDLI
ncbi:MAG: phosphatase PAP2-related protein [Patescibacteria group bacterium]